MPVRYLVLLIILTGALPASASAVAAPISTAGWLYPKIQYLAEPPNQPPLSPSQALRQKGWKQLARKVPNFGYVTNGYWFRFTLPKAHLRELNRFISISYPQLDHIDFYLLKDGHRIQSDLTGDRLPFNSRPVKHPQFLFPVHLQPGHQYEALFRVQTQGTLQVPFRIWEPGPLIAHLSYQDQLHAIYYGILIAIIVFNFFVFLVLREATYLYYVLCTFSYLLFMATLRGTTFAWVWPDWPWLQNQSMLVSIPLAMLFSSVFARSFLHLREENPKLDWLVRITVYANLFALAGTFVFGYNLSVRLSVALAIPTCLLLASVGPIQWVRGSRAARFYAIAWAMLTLASMITAMNKYGFFPTNFITEYSIELGSALEALLLTLALAERIYLEREAKVRAQAAQLREQGERRQAELRLMDQALHHPVTRLPNRICFEMLLRDLIKREADQTHAVGVLQLQNYRAISKTLGHGNTDRVLLAAARHFNQLFVNFPGIRIVEQDESQTFYIASLEIDTFAFILRADEAKSNSRAISRRLEALREPIAYLGMQLPLDPIAGIAVYPEHGDDPQTLIREAYIALETHSARDNKLAYYQPELDLYNTDRLTLVSDLKNALANDELEVYYQPKVALKGLQVVGVEALIRWPQRSNRLGVEELIAVAEQTGLIKPLTRWVLEQAARAREAFVNAGFDLTVSVNISPHNLRETDFPLHVQRVMTSHQLEPGSILLEVTETSMMRDPTNSLSALNALDRAGFPLSIDDFGSGYSSLSYIKSLPAREIKIDRSLITELLDQQDDRVIVQTTIDMCHSLGYRVVAEGVEYEETLTLLEAMGCDMVQGFFLTPPLPLDEIKRWLRERDDADPASLRA